MCNVAYSTIATCTSSNAVNPPISPLPLPDFQASVQKSGNGRGAYWRIYGKSPKASLFQPRQEGGVFGARIKVKDVLGFDPKAD